jgi:hypothetical protein
MQTDICLFLIFISIALIISFHISARKERKLPIRSIFEKAINNAAAMLSNDCTQDLAIAAATSCLAIWLKDPVALAVCTKIITQAVPAITKAMCQIQPDCGEDRYTRSIVRRILYRESEEFTTLVDLCVEEYSKQMKDKCNKRSLF